MTFSPENLKRVRVFDRAAKTELQSRGGTGDLSDGDDNRSICRKLPKPFRPTASLEVLMLWQAAKATQRR